MRVGTEDAANTAATTELFQKSARCMGAKFPMAGHERLGHLMSQQV